MGKHFVKRYPDQPANPNVCASRLAGVHCRCWHDDIAGDCGSMVGKPEPGRCCDCGQVKL